MRMSRGADFVILKNHLRPNKPNGMGLETGPRGENGKTKCVSAFCFGEITPPKCTSVTSRCDCSIAQI